MTKCGFDIFVWSAHLDGTDLVQMPVVLFVELQVQRPQVFLQVG
ncbi:MAG TPA: hypothetical protein VFC03_00675 [Acidimicrobiales bacterium]|nr:hypothetical protein [Acidimicrobiales bacterium]